MSANYVITIGRQFGSGGRELGKKLADRLGIQFYDKELMLKAAQESGISESYFISNDERVPRFINGAVPFSFGINPMPWYAGTSSISDDSIYRAQSDFILHAVQQGPCVIVGRTADYVLRDMPNVIRVFVHAKMEDCVKRIISRTDIKDENKARKEVERVNKLRANYYNFYTDKKWGDAASYDLTFNSSRLSIDAIVDLIENYLKAEYLSKL